MRKSSGVSGMTCLPCRHRRSSSTSSKIRRGLRDGFHTHLRRNWRRRWPGQHGKYRSPSNTRLARMSAAGPFPKSLTRFLHDLHRLTPRHGFDPAGRIFRSSANSNIFESRAFTRFATISPPRTIRRPCGFVFSSLAVLPPSDVAHDAPNVLPLNFRDQQGSYQGNNMVLKISAILGDT